METSATSMYKADYRKPNIMLFLARAIVGFLFIFSGLIKVNDPLGFGYKLQEYFEVFHLGFLDSIAVPLAVILCTIEIVSGVLLLFGFYSRKVAWALLALIVFFTLLTFISAVFKVVTSCGCFGDAIPLTPWQSFGKDLFLLVLIAYIFLNRNEIRPAMSGTRIQRNVAYAAALISLLLGVYTINFLPVVDFLPYKAGANIPESMTAPAGSKPDEYQMMYHLKNKKTAAEQDMTDADYLKTEIWKDPNWEIIGIPVKKLIKEGYKIKIRDLGITDRSGTDYTHEIIENPYYNLIIVAYDLNAANQNAIGRINALAINAAEQFNTRTVLLTSTSAGTAERFSKKMKLFPEIFYADNVPLKSMVRANPGVLLLKNGIVINKWHYNNMPDFDELTAQYFSK